MSDKQKKIVHVKFKGKCAWAKVQPGQEVAPFKITKYNKDDRHYEILVECSKDKFNKLLKAGIDDRTKLKTSEELKVDGDSTYIKLRATKVRDDMVFEDPKVVNEDGLPIANQIGNGSDIEAIAQLAETKDGGKVLRLKEIKVINLVDYEAKVEIVDFDSGEVSGQKEEPKKPAEDNEFF